MFKFRKCVVGWLLLLSTIVVPGYVFAGNPFEVLADIEDHPEQEVQIVFTIRNGGKPVKIIKDELPWISRYAVTILVTTSFNGTADFSLDEIFEPLTPSTPEEIIQLEPWETISGRVVLGNNRFPKFEALRKTGRLVVFWSYKPDYSLPEQPRSGGWFSIGPSRSP